MTKELLDLLVKSDLAALTPDEAAQRFAALGQVQRSQPVPEVLSLVSRAAGERLEINYALDAHRGWRFVQAKLQLSAASVEESTELYHEAERLLRAKLKKKPAYVRHAEGPLPSIAWKLGRNLEVSVWEGEAVAGRATPRVVELLIGQPQGEGN